MSTIEVKVPDIGDFTDVPVIEVLVKAGDKVKVDDSLVTLESDKATMDVPSTVAGTVKSVAVKVGDKVSEGSVVVAIESAAPSPGHSRSGGARLRPRQRGALTPAHSRKREWEPGSGESRGSGFSRTALSPKGRRKRSRRGQGPRHRRLRRRAGDRGVREAGRRGEGRRRARHARERQGDDGRAVHGRGHGEVRPGEGGRQGRRRIAGRRDRRRGRAALTPALSRKRERERGPGRRLCGSGSSRTRFRACPCAATPSGRSRTHANRRARRRAGVPRRARVAVGAHEGARARRRHLEGAGHRAEGTHPGRGRARVRQEGAHRRGDARCPRGRRRDQRRRRVEPDPVAEGRLREVRAGRGEAALPHQEAVGREPRAQLGDDPARHAVRRGGHHRPRGAARRAQQGEREGGRQADDARVPDQGFRRGAEEVPRLQRLARRRQPGA